MPAGKRPARQERSDARQKDLFARKDSGESLRAVHVTVNEAARRENFVIFENMRVPEGSIIHRVFYDVPHGEAIENLSTWKASNGFALPDRVVKVEAKRSWESVDALIIPKKHGRSVR